MTEYDTYPSQSSTVEGCRHIGHFRFLGGRWRMTSRCAFRVTPHIRSEHTPNRGGEVTCDKECDSVEDCETLARKRD